MNPKWLFQRLLVLSEVTGCAFPQACGSECVEEKNHEKQGQISTKL
jgi:hypothetical protein